MPIYEYECSNCKFYVEALQKISEPPLVKCPSCKKQTLKRLVSAPVFRLKGGGWYETDFKSDKEGKRNLAMEREEPKAAVEESKAETKAPATESAAKPSEPKAPSISTAAPGGAPKRRAAAPQKRPAAAAKASARPASSRAKAKPAARGKAAKRRSRR